MCLFPARSEPVPDPYFKWMAWFEAIGFEHGRGVRRGGLRCRIGCSC